MNHPELGELDAFDLAMLRAWGIRSDDSRAPQLIRIGREQRALERWRKEMIVSDLLSAQALNEIEWSCMRRRIVNDGLDGHHTNTVRKLKQRIDP